MTDASPVPVSPVPPSKTTGQAAAFDHVVVGAGINGLVAAALLSRRGGKVLVLEREDHIGGCMRSAEVTAPGFLHDVLATTFVLFVTSPAYAELGADLARHGLEFCHSPHPTAVLRPNGESLVLTRDRACNIGACSARAEGDGASYGRDVGEIEANAQLLFGLLGGALWSGATFRLLAREFWRRGMHGLSAYIGSLLVPARGWLETSYASPLTQALFAPWVRHCGLSPEDSTSAQMAKVVAFALEAAGAPIVKGGAANAATALRRLIEERSGSIRTRSPVDRILVEKGRATGVALSSGEIIRARKSVIASLTPSELYGRLLGEAAPQFTRDKAAHFRHGSGNFQLHYALDRAPRWIADGLEKVALIHLSEGLDAVSKSYNEAMRGLLPQVPTICVGQPAALDSSRCPPGKAILWIQVPDAPRQVKGDASGTIATSGSWDEATREAFADRIEAILARHIRDFRRSILGRHACSPADLQSINVNLAGGDPYGGACSIDQFFTWRPFTGSVNHHTGIKGLYHIGASTHPGPGLAGGSGYLVARELA
ncbi:MAG: NAD(P)/FAD-dependent oxidoreductase [Alphaproteobacteria bacterium]|nr:NAD(P)/FAD-dependent oxidoreductase [Alphaproteobacteria bacterium]